MKLKRRFYDSSINFKDISIERLVLGIVIGLAFAFAIYSFAYLLRELFRLMSNGLGHLPNILSERDRSVYNWFFAVLSLIFGNSIAISIILGGSNCYFGKKQFKNRRIINDQIFLNTSFAYLFLKLCYIIGIFSATLTDFNFLPELNYLIILLVIVLYLDTWKTLSLTFKKYRLKFMLIHFLTLFISACSLSKLEIVDYKKIDNNQLKYKPINDLPNSNFDNVTWKDHYLDTFLKDKNEEKLSFGYFDNDLENTHLDFLDYKLRLYDGYRENAAIRISANRDEKMFRIKNIENQVRKAEIPYMIFATYNENVLAKRFSNNGVKIKLVESGYQEDNVLKNFHGNKTVFFKVDNTIKPQVTLCIKFGNSLMINNRIIQENLLVQKFQQKINKNIIFKYEFDSNTTYQSYITVLSSHLKAIEILREKNNKVQLKWDNQKYKYTNKEEFLKEQQRLRYEFPFLMVEQYN